MTRNDEIILCRAARLDDAGTRQAVRDRVLPALRKEADELEACRLQCEARVDWLDDWVSTGMLTEEVTIRQAIAHAEKRLAEYACPKRWVATISFDENNVPPLVTEINGTPDSIRAYYMQDGGRLNVGHFAQDKLAHVSHIAFKQA